MIETLLQSLNMGGYGLYVWSSYGIVIGLLTLQLFRPWRRLRQLKEKPHAK